MFAARPGVHTLQPEVTTAILLDGGPCFLHKLAYTLLKTEVIGAIVLDGGPCLLHKLVYTLFNSR